MKLDPLIYLYFLTIPSLSVSHSFLHGGIIHYITPDLVLLPAIWRLHERPTHPLEIGWRGVRVYLLLPTQLMVARVLILLFAIGPNHLVIRSLGQLVHLSVLGLPCMPPVTSVPEGPGWAAIVVM